MSEELPTAENDVWTGSVDPDDYDNSIPPPNPYRVIPPASPDEDQ